MVLLDAATGRQPWLVPWPIFPKRSALLQAEIFLPSKIDHNRAPPGWGCGADAKRTSERVSPTVVDVFKIKYRMSGFPKRRWLELSKVCVHATSNPHSPFFLMQNAIFIGVVEM